MKSTSAPFAALPALCLLSLYGAGCGGTTAGNPTITTTSASEIAESTLSGAVNSTEPAGSQAYYRAAPGSRRVWALLDALSPVSASYAGGNACATLAQSFSGCSSGALTIDYSGCNFSGSAADWNGSQILGFAGGGGSGGCPSVLSLTGLRGVTLTRTFGAGTTETNVLGVATAIDTVGAQDSGYNKSVVIAGEGEQAVFSGSESDGSRTLTILGVHLTGTYQGATLYDHTISSGAVTVSGAGASRAVPAGNAVTVQHNKAQYTASAAITTQLAYTIPGCCHPGSGVITTTYTGSQTGTETLTFSGTCGQATLANSSGSSTLTLSHCF